MHFPEHTATIYRSKPEFLKELCEEIGKHTLIVEDLVFSPLKKMDASFALDIWLDPQIMHFESISQAVKILRQAGKFWYLHPVNQIRRSKLIEAQLRKCPPLPRSFPLNEEIPSIGAFSLLDQNTLVYSTHRSKQWPDGNCYFIEDKINPPNRAYLKLWEALFLLNHYPKAGDTVLDLGASPGGWTYVMQSLGAHVTSVDKAQLDPKITALPNIRYLQQSAFALEPEKLIDPYDWVLSDIACYPDRAYHLITRWINSKKAKRLIITIKLQGQTDMKIIQQLKEIPNSRLQHLFHNKHEVTFFYPV